MAGMKEWLIRSLQKLAETWGLYMRGHTPNTRGFGATVVEYYPPMFLRFQVTYTWKKSNYLIKHYRQL